MKWTSYHITSSDVAAISTVSIILFMFGSAVAISLGSKWFWGGIVGLSIIPSLPIMLWLWNFIWFFLFLPLAGKICYCISYYADFVLLNLPTELREHKKIRFPGE